MSRSRTSRTNRSHIQGDRVRRPAAALLGCAMAASFAVTAPAYAGASSPAYSPPTHPDGMLPAVTADAAPPVPIPVALRSQRTAYQVVVPQPVAQQLNSTGGPRHAAPVHRAGGGVERVLPAPRPVAEHAAGEHIKIGNIDFRRPGSISPQAARQITAGSEDIVRGISDVLRGNGVPDARADKVAEQMVGDAAVGGVIGGAVALPLGLAIGAPTGGVIGFLFGIPFLPTGLVVGPVVGTALVAGLVALPAVTAGVVAGAVHGYQKGWTVPLDAPKAKHRLEDRHHEGDGHHHPQAASAPVDHGIAPQPVARTAPPAAEPAPVNPPAGFAPVQAVKEAVGLPELPLPQIKLPELPPLPTPPAPTPAVAQANPAQAPGSCSPGRMVEVVLKGGPIGSC